MTADWRGVYRMHGALVVDDDPLIRRLLLSALSSQGRSVTLADDGTDGWDRFQREQPRLVVTDWEMPGLTGPELIDKIRTIDDEQTYIVILTARSELDDLLVGLEAGADDYVRKPFSPDELGARLAVGDRMLGMQDRLRYLGSTDELTGMLNRRAIDERVRAELDRCKRGISPCSIALIDVDKFKLVNDTAGHQAGDGLLRNLAGTISNQTVSYGSAGRWGGDEFLVVVPGASGSMAGKIATRIAQDVRKLVVPRVGHVSVSIGIATAELGESRQLESMMIEADAALYRVKDNGGDGIAISTERDIAA